jgi:hypothetical protein
MAEWSEDHVAAIWSLNSKLWFSSSWLNWRPSGVHRWKVETTDWEGRGVVCDKSVPPRLYPLLESVNDRWVGPASKYWMYWSHAGVYGPSKLSSWSPTGAWLTPTASLVGLGEKLGMDPRSVSRHDVDCVGNYFSWEQWDPSKSVGVS